MRERSGGQHTSNAEAKNQDKHGLSEEREAQAAETTRKRQCLMMLWYCV